MNETPPSVPETEAPPAADMSLFERLTNVVAAPGDVFEHVRQAPGSVANWLVPAALFVVVSCLAAALLLSQGWARYQMLEIQEKALQQQVQKGKMTEEQAKQASATMERFAGISQAIQFYGGALLIGLLSPLLWAAALWLYGVKVLKGHFTFLKALEAASLPFVIGVLGVVVDNLLRMVTGNLFAGLSPTLLLGDFDATKPLHGILALLNLFALWELAVRSVALAALARRSFGAAAAGVFGAWAIFYGGLIAIGWAVRTAVTG